MGFSSSAHLKLSVIRAASTLVAFDNSTAPKNASYNERKDQMDLRGVLALVKQDYDALAGSGDGMIRPELILFLRRQPATGWNALQRLRDQYHTRVIVYWLSDHKIEAGERLDLETVLTVLSPSEDGQQLYKIYEPPGSMSAAFCVEIFSKLRERLQVELDQAIKPLAPVKRSSGATHASDRGTTMPAPGFQMPATTRTSQQSGQYQVVESRTADTASGKQSPSARSSDAMHVTSNSLKKHNVPLGDPEQPGVQKMQSPQVTDEGTQSAATPITREQHSTELPDATAAGQKAAGDGESELLGEAVSRGAVHPAQTDESPAPGVPAKWEIKEPAETSDPTPHTRQDVRPTSGTPDPRGWLTIGASKRGRLHEHEGTFREDEFAIELDGGWHLVAVADGAGSKKLSRVGSRLAVHTAVKVMQKAVTSSPPSIPVIKVALQEALQASLKALYEEAQKPERSGDVKDFSTTLLLLAFHPGKSIVGFAQIGDGLIAAQREDESGSIVLLGTPEAGEYSGQTYFLTNYKYEELPAKAQAIEAKNPIRYFLVMTDGVADDLYPPEQRLPGLIKPMPEIIASERPDESLLKLINYDRQASFDDRTLVVLCQPAKTTATQQSVSEDHNA